MPTTVTFENLTEHELLRLAEEIAFALFPGDVVALEGDLGAGKTTLARGLIRALCGGAMVEVPSPTFTLVQTYETQRFDVAHFDLYRMTDANELAELGLDAALRRGVAVIEWPSRATKLIPAERITIALADTGIADARNVVLTVSGNAEARIKRMAAIRSFLTRHGWGSADTRFSYLQGDASARRYARLKKLDGSRAILMDAPRQPDGPAIRDGKPYSRIAHLAEDVRPFVAIAQALASSGFATPEIYTQDMDQGLLIIEDFGDAVFGAEAKRGEDQSELWRRGTDVLIALRQHRPPLALPLPDGSGYTLPELDSGTMQIETELLLDWYWPAAFGVPVPTSVRAHFLVEWSKVFARILRAPKGWMLRDYHSPNLISVAGAKPPRDVGIIDFQDALRGPDAYDLVSLLQDARVDVPAELERQLLDYYIGNTERLDATFNGDDFRYSYAVLGAQRNTKILGIFARLAKRDGKRQYLAHIPRIWGYLVRDLAYPDLAGLRTWYDNNLPPEMRGRALSV